MKESNEIDVRFLLCFVFKCLKKIKEIETSVNKSLHLVRSGFLMNILCLCVCARALDMSTWSDRHKYLRHTKCEYVVRQT